MRYPYETAEYVREVQGPDGQILIEEMFVRSRDNDWSQDTMFYLVDDEGKDVGLHTWRHHVTDGSITTLEDTMPPWWKVPAQSSHFQDVCLGYHLLGMRPFIPLGV